MDAEDQKKFRELKSKCELIPTPFNWADRDWLFAQVELAQATIEEKDREIERLKANQKETWPSVYSCQNCEKTESQLCVVKEALEKARTHEQSWLEHGSYNGKEDGTVDLLAIIEQALTHESHGPLTPGEGGE